MTKLCPRGKAAAKRKFKVYPSAYANAYASRICAGKIKDPSGVKRKDFKGRKPAQDGGSIGIGPFSRRKTFRELKEPVRTPIMGAKTKAGENARKMFNLKMKQFEKLKELKKNQKRTRPKKMMGGGLMEATQKLRRQGLKEGGNSKSRTNPDNLTGAQIRELEKLNLLDKGMRDKVSNLPVVSSRKIAGPVKGALRNTFEQSKKPKKNRSKPKFKAMGGRINYRKGGGADTGKKGEGMSRLLTAFLRSSPRTRSSKRTEKMGGGMMRPMYRKGGGVCLRGMNRDAIGKNS